MTSTYIVYGPVGKGGTRNGDALKRSRALVVAGAHGINTWDKVGQLAITEGIIQNPGQYFLLKEGGHGGLINVEGGGLTATAVRAENG